MVYITLDELKEILPEILDQWIDEDDESWEWIFNEIEQKCHIGKKKKDKKQKKYAERLDELTRKVDVVTPQLIADLNSRVDELRKYTTDNLSSRINRLSNDIEVAKSMAQTAKQRTEVDYTKCSKEKSEADVVQEIYNRMSGRGATFEELNTFRNLLQKYDALEKKEIQVIKKSCKTCKYYTNREARCGIHNSELDCYSIIGPCVNYSKWEAKDNG